MWEDLKVAGRPCTGRLTAAGESRHPRPAGRQLEISALYAVDYGVVDRHEDGGRKMVPMDLRPLHDLLGAVWDGCDPCRQQHVEAIAAAPPLLVHMVGVTMLSMEREVTTAQQLMLQLDPPGTAIAITIRNEGLLPAVDVVQRMTLDQRRSVVSITVGALLPMQWLDMPVSNLCPPVVPAAHKELGDQRVAANLRQEGLLPPTTT